LKSPQLIQQIRMLANQQSTIKSKENILKKFGLNAEDNGLQLLKTLIRPQQVIFTKYVF
jgi:hypothetical protein